MGQTVQVPTWVRDARSPAGALKYSSSLATRYGGRSCACLRTIGRKPRRKLRNQLKNHSLPQQMALSRALTKDMEAIIVSVAPSKPDLRVPNVSTIDTQSSSYRTDSTINTISEWRLHSHPNVSHCTRCHPSQPLPSGATRHRAHQAQDAHVRPYYACSLTISSCFSSVASTWGLR